GVRGHRVRPALVGEGRLRERVLGQQRPHPRRGRGEPDGSTESDTRVEGLTGRPLRVVVGQEGRTGTAEQVVHGVHPLPRGPWGAGCARRGAIRGAAGYSRTPAWPPPDTRRRKPP